MKIHLTSTPGNLSAAVLGAIVEVNRACWHARQNQGVEGASGIDVLLPEKIDFQVELIADDGLNALSRTNTSVEPSVTTTRRQTEGEQISTSLTDSSSSQNSTAQKSSSVGTIRNQTDERTERYEYESTD